MWWAETRTFSAFCFVRDFLREEKTEPSDLPLQHRKGAIGAIAASGGISRVFFFWEGKKKKKKLSYYKNHNQSSFLFLSIRMGFTRSTNNKISTTSTVYQQLWHSDNNGSSAKKIKTQSRWLTHTHYIKLVQQTRKELTTQPWRSARESLCLFNKQKGAFYFIFFFSTLFRRPCLVSDERPFLPLAHFERTVKKLFFFFFFFVYSHTTIDCPWHDHVFSFHGSLGFL